MKQLFSYLDPNSSLPAGERQVRLLAAVLCGVYVLAAIYLVVVGGTMLLQSAAGAAQRQLSWGLGLVGLSFLLAGITLGLWRLRHWAITFSALILLAALVYSILDDLEAGSWWMAILKAVVIAPAIATGHGRLWRHSKAGPE